LPRELQTKDVVSKVEGKVPFKYKS